MNYIKEINAFYDHIERNPLSASAVTLWHALMHINNKAMWIESFTVAAPVLRLKAGLTESSFKRARTELKDKGYITYESRGNGQAPAYRMAGLSQGMDQHASCGMGADAGQGADRKAGESADGCVGVNADQGVNRDVNRGMDRGAGRRMNQEASHHTSPNTVPLVKQKKDNTKPNDTKRYDTGSTTDAFVFYQDNFGVISPFVSDALLNWVDDVGEELVLDAMRRALERGKRNWGYVKGILQAWAQKGITSVEAARAEEAAFRRSRQQPSYGAGKAEVVPEWFKEQKRQEKWKREQEQAARESRDQEADWGEVEALLEKYRSG
ncbi:hypothetical protein GCM10007063_25920 [Lentibacillus kapialis]|uniref:DnaB/C C-terminal domain-containing protein n=1 Tax=Lentibacillus kapialis TaxID=340214 RepID=A0A917PZX9_9BACI|nr:DnaD domain protein [Lentibacillus kapialis]GGK02423.1 hypothetical protein GCM10007063_25920 [Lentibacillus kapialis]